MITEIAKIIHTVAMVSILGYFAVLFFIVLAGSAKHLLVEFKESLPTLSKEKGVLRNVADVIGYIIFVLIISILIIFKLISHFVG